MKELIIYSFKTDEYYSGYPWSLNLEIRELNQTITIDSLELKLSILLNDEPEEETIHKFLTEGIKYLFIDKIMYSTYNKERKKMFLIIQYYLDNSEEILKGTIRASIKEAKRTLDSLEAKLKYFDNNQELNEVKQTLRLVAPKVLDNLSNKKQNYARHRDHYKETSKYWIDSNKKVVKVEDAISTLESLIE